MSELKDLKELFVSDLHGGSLGEIYWVTTVSLSGWFAFVVVQNVLQAPVPFVLDFTLNVLVILMAITLYSGDVGMLHLMILVPAVLVWAQHWAHSTNKTNGKGRGNGNGHRHAKTTKLTLTSDQLLEKKPFITVYRSHMIVITVLAILAVDFHIFPRRFAKAETWGTSLMDLGVGLFVFSMGLANSRSLIKASFRLSDESTFQFRLGQWFRLIMGNTVKALPVLALGMIRLVSVKTLEYQEHVTEYGIHWNFFVTLGLIPILLGILDPVLNMAPRFIVALGLSVAYEVILTRGGLLAFVLRSDNRMENIVTMNKEGIFSLVGYLAIFLYGQSFGSFVLTVFTTPNNLYMMCSSERYHKSSKKKSWATVTTGQGLAIMTGISQVLSIIAQESFWCNSPSRRLVNLSYTLWVLSFNSTLLFGYFLVDRYFGGSFRESRILNAINKNGLFIFLLGNLMTGLVNMSINTLTASDFKAFAILVAYSSTICIIAYILDKRGVYIKL